VQRIICTTLCFGLPVKTRTLTGRLLVALLMFGSAATGAFVSGLPTDAQTVKVTATDATLSSSVPRSSDALLSSGATAATAVTPIEKRTPSLPFRRGTPAHARDLDTTAPSVVLRPAERDAGHRHSLHLSRSGADGRHTGTPPPSAGH
jgi:hypothetical protein